MKLVETSLCNVCQFEKLRVKFRSGLVGVFGRNGAGKSNMLKLGGYANLTNDYTRNRKPKAENVRQLAGEKDRSYTETIWEHDDQKFTLHRGLREQDTLLAPTLAEPLHKASEIDGWLVKLTGMPNLNYLLDNYVFVDQDEFKRFLEDKPEERAKGYASLCGTTIAEKCWSALGDQLTKDQPLALEILDTGDELKTSIGVQEELRERTAAEIAAENKKLLSKKEHARLRAVVASAERRRELRREWPGVKNEYDVAKAAYRERKTRYEECEQALERAEAAAVGVDVKMIEVKTQLASLDDRRKAAESKAETERRLAESEPPSRPSVEEPSDVTLEDLREKIADCKQAVERARTILANFAKTGAVECEHCGTEATAVAAGLERHEHELSQRTVQLANLRLVLKTCTEDRKQWEDYRRDLEAYRLNKGLLENTLKTLGDAVAPKPSELKQLRRKEQQYQDLLDAVEEARDELNLEQEPYEAAKNEYRDARRDCRKACKELQTLRVDRAVVTAAAQSLAVHDAAKLSLAALRERHRLADEAVAEKTAELEALQARLRQTARMREWLKLLQEMRSVVHRDRLPRVVHEGYQRQLLPEANAMLDRFGGPFRLSAGPALNFVAEKPDGTIENAESLSGGEKGVTALAVRWSVYLMSAASLGLLVFDEPTAGLDEENMRYLEQALPALSAEAKSRGLQIIVVTHERSLKSVFDQVIEVGA